MNNIKFFYLSYKPRKVWSKELSEYKLSYNIDNQVWAHKDKPLKGELLDIYEIKKKLELPHDGKKTHRDVMMRFVKDEYFPIKELCPIKYWDGVIISDLDNQHSPLIMKMSRIEQEKFYDEINMILQDICPNHFMYIERSSSWYGFHILFYFDCERTEENFKKCAQFVYELFRFKIDEYIENFSHIFTMPECLKDNGKSYVFDDVYKRPYQKFYLTGIDCIIHNCDGCMDDVVLIDEESYNKKIEKKVDNKLRDNYFKIEYKNKKEISLDHNDRFYIITALKRYCKNRQEAYKLWYDFCPNIKLYKNYKTQDFINQFEREYDRADISTAHIEILKKYGFKVDERNINYFLKDDEYLGKYLDDIIEQCEVGVNLLVSPTGSGKNQSWINWYEILSNDIMNNDRKSVVLVEPLNSIIETKYDNNKHKIITGSKRIEESDVENFNLIVTNYNHFLIKRMDSNEEVYEQRKDIGKILEKCQLLIIDESHILIKDLFRSNVLIEFIQMIRNNNDKCKIIIQTATPMLEQALFDIKKTFIIHKDLNKKIKYIFRSNENKFDILNISCLINYYVKNGKKVYVYWNDGSLNNMKKLQIAINNLIIYHKRDLGSEDMIKMNEEHVVNDKVLISSVYFGVGNDLNDEEDAAVIIIGNNVVQEDIQAIGRWRNSKNIEVCQILMNSKEKEEFENSKESVIDLDKLINKYEKEYEYRYKDKILKEESIVIRGKSYMIRKPYYCKILAIMAAADYYYKQAKVKIDYFKKLGYDVREKIKELKNNSNFIEEVKNFNNIKKSHKVEVIRKMLNGEDCIDERNKDEQLNRIYKIIRGLERNDLLKDVSCLNTSSFSKLMKYETYLKYYYKEKYEKSDYAELFSMLWYRDNINKMNNQEYIVMNKKLKGSDYCMLYAYLLWLVYRDKDNENNDLLKMNYYREYERKCIDISKVEEILIDEIFSKNYLNNEFEEFYKQFFNNYKIDENKVSKESLFDMIRRMNVNEDYMKKEIDFILKMKDDKEMRKLGGKLGSPKKKCIITDKFNKKKLEKYNLKIGQEFESYSSLALYVNKGNDVITQWKKKNWIE